MALLLRALGNRDALHPEYTNASKKTLSCLRKCCRACIRMRSARSPATQQCIRAMMRAVRENAMQTNVNIAGSACAAGVFVISTFDDRRAFDVVATHRCRLKAHCADSESRFLAIKKFSCPRASRLIIARQNRIFARIAAADSQCDFSSARYIAAHGERLMHACVRIKCGVGGDAGVTSRRSDAEFGLEQIVHRLRIGLAAG